MDKAPTSVPQNVDRKDQSIFLHRNQRVHIPVGYMAVGLIVGAHGIRGEVKVELHTDFPERFDAGSTLFLGDALREIEIEQARLHKGQMLLRLAGVRERGQAEDLRGNWLFIDEKDAAPLEADTFWIHDIVGLQVRSELGEVLGVVVQVLGTGANDVYLVETEATVNGGKELLLPAIADVIQQVDLENGVMTVQLPPGLIDG